MRNIHMHIKNHAKCRSPYRCHNALSPRFDVKIARHVKHRSLAVPDLPPPRRSSSTNEPNMNHTPGPTLHHWVARISSPTA
jgi:hypothetical protein